MSAKTKLTVKLPNGELAFRTTNHVYTHVLAAALTADRNRLDAEKHAVYLDGVAADYAARGDDDEKAYGLKVAQRAAEAHAAAARFAAMPADELVWFDYSWHGSFALANKAHGTVGGKGYWDALKVVEV